MRLTSREWPSWWTTTRTRSRSRSRRQWPRASWWSPECPGRPATRSPRADAGGHRARPRRAVAPAAAPKGGRRLQGRHGRRPRCGGRPAPAGLRSARGAGRDERVVAAWGPRCQSTGGLGRGDRACGAGHLGAGRVARPGGVRRGRRGDVAATHRRQQGLPASGAPTGGGADCARRRARDEKVALLHGRFGIALSLHHSALDVPRSLEHLDAAERLHETESYRVHTDGLRWRWSGSAPPSWTRPATPTRIGERDGGRDLVVAAGWARGGAVQPWAPGRVRRRGRDDLAGRA